MVIELCNCGWDIPGVETLPWHEHRLLSTYRGLGKGGPKIVKTMSWVDPKSCISQEEVIIIHVKWKDVVRGLQG